MTVNEAYKVLKRPGSRAEYLLGLHGVEIADNERIEPGLIMEILEAREELAEAMAADDQGKLDELEEAMLDRRDQALERIAGAFGELQANPAPDALQAIKRQLILLRYIDRYLEQFDIEDDQAA
jgi:molecular chaperone HscB